MGWYYYIAIALIASQALFLIQAFNNYRYVLTKYKRTRTSYQPRVALIVPCKNLDSEFQKNITSFFNQGYDNYLLRFVVSDKSDPAYPELVELTQQLSQSSKARDVQIYVAGRADSCSQKVHNLLYCCQKVLDDVEVLAFADSDVCVPKDWLNHIVYPLRHAKRGATTGYRWYVPESTNFASLALSAINAKVAQLLGNTIFNQAWGGSMAIRVDVFRKIGLDNIWQCTVSDDLTLSSAVKKARMKVEFVPACLVASYEQTTWPKLFEFARRQFLITRVCAPKTWWFGLFSGLYSVLGLWAAAFLAFYAAITADKNLALYVTVPVAFFAGQMIGAILRQKMIRKLLKADLHKLKVAAIADVFLFWLWSILLLIFVVSSAFGRTICWRGISYKLISPTKTIILR